MTFVYINGYVPKIVAKIQPKTRTKCYFFLGLGLELRTDIKWLQIYIMHENNMYKTGNYKIELTQNQMKANALLNIIFSLIV